MRSNCETDVSDYPSIYKNHLQQTFTEQDAPLRFDPVRSCHEGCMAVGAGSFLVSVSLFLESVNRKTVRCQRSHLQIILLRDDLGRNALQFSTPLSMVWEKNKDFRVTAFAGILEPRIN
jgi:hypothetical protein